MGPSKWMKWAMPKRCRARAFFPIAGEALGDIGDDLGDVPAAGLGGAGELDGALLGQARE